jgi:peptidyl-prolyl cis-trans isomerase SurA
MIKKITFITFVILSISFNNIASANIAIVADVDNEIITNHDLRKESNYLKILNPDLAQLNNDQILELAKNSLVKEIIKKKEIKKFLDINSENSLVEQYLIELYAKLNLSSEEDFKKLLEQKNGFTLDEVKKKIKIELFWNEVIYAKYINQLKIDKEKIIKKIDRLKNDNYNEYLLSEIIFVKKKDLPLENLINEIQQSINEIGFNNTANIYSVSESSKLGGKLGWINENSLSKPILEKLKIIDTGKYTDVINIGNNFLLLKVEQVRINELEINKEKEYKKLIQIETNKQLNQFSKIYFDKSKMNYSINEK